MSRHGYSEDLDDWELASYRGRVANALKGRRSQRFLRELRETLDAMPEKVLSKSSGGELVNAEGACCALGAVALARGWEDARAVDSSDHRRLGDRLDIAPCVVAEIEYENDEAAWSHEEPDAVRWQRVRAWVDRQIKDAPTAAPTT